MLENDLDLDYDFVTRLQIITKHFYWLYPYIIQNILISFSFNIQKQGPDYLGTKIFGSGSVLGSGSKFLL